METTNFKELRISAGLTLSQLSELSGYSITTINQLEINNEGSKRLRDKLMSILLQNSEEGTSAEVQHWRDRALLAEEKLKALKEAMSAWIKKI